MFVIEITCVAQIELMTAMGQKTAVAAIRPARPQYLK
jgi:hypothetical protein